MTFYEVGASVREYENFLYQEAVEASLDIESYRRRDQRKKRQQAEGALRAYVTALAKLTDSSTTAIRVKVRRKVARHQQRDEAA